MGPHSSSLVFLQYLTTVFDTIADGILLISIEPGGFRMTMANKRFFEVSGYAESVIGKLVQDVVPAESFQFVTRQYRKVIRSKKPLEYLRWAEVPLGMRAYHVRMAPILNTTGDCVQIACVIQDQTEREQLQAEVERLRATVRGINNALA